MKPGTSADSARRFLAAYTTRTRQVDLDAWTLDALERIADARRMTSEAVLAEMLDDWQPRPEDAARARRRPR